MIETDSLASGTLLPLEPALDAPTADAPEASGAPGAPGAPGAALALPADQGAP